MSSKDTTPGAMTPPYAMPRGGAAASGAAERRFTRPELFLQVADLLHSGHSVEVLGDRGSGRSRMLVRLREHFTTLGWRAIAISGMAAFRSSSLMALALQGVAESTDPRTPPLVGAFRALADQVRAERTVLVVDDADLLDDASWGVICAVSAQHDVPVVCSRLTAERRTSGAPSGLSSVYSVDLPVMDYVELESALERSTGLRFEPATLSRLFAKSGGSIGLASTVLDAALRAERVVVEDGIAHATGSLWTPALRHAAEELLRPLTADDVVAVKTLAMLGPTDLRTASDVIGEDAVLRLERAAFALVADAGDRRVIVVNPPLLVEYFRHDSLRAERAALFDRIDRSLSGSARPLADFRGPQDPAVAVRLVHEQTRLTTLKAREAWHDERSLAHATALLAALDADHVHDAEETTRLVLEADRLPGDPAVRASWEITRARHEAFHRGDIDGAISRLHRVATSLADDGLRLIAAACTLETTFRTPPQDEPFVDLDIDTLPVRVQVDILATRAYWLLIRGEYTRCAAVLATEPLAAANPEHTDLVAVYLHVAEGTVSEGEAIAQRGLEAASARADASGIRLYSFLVAFCASFERRYADAEAIVTRALSLGQSAGEHPVCYRGLTLLGALFAIERGNVDTADAQLSSLDELGLPDGPLPALSRAFVEIRRDLATDDPAEAASLAREAGDALWERGARLAACTIYLDGLAARFDQDDWLHCAPRLREVDVRTVAGFVTVIERCLAGDVAAVRAVVEQEQRTGRSAIAGRYAQTALGLLEPGDVSPEDRAVLEAARLGRARPVLPPGAAALTSREREVAELIASGLSNGMIAEALVVSVRTVESHVNKLLKKSGAKDRQGIRDFVIASELHA